MKLSKKDICKLDFIADVIAKRKDRCTLKVFKSKCIMRNIYINVSHEGLEFIKFNPMSYIEDLTIRE